jgi:hypothetical protein
MCLRHSLVVDVAAGAALMPAIAELRSIWFLWLARLLAVFCSAATMCGVREESRTRSHIERVPSTTRGRRREPKLGALFLGSALSC